RRCPQTRCARGITMVSILKSDELAPAGIFQAAILIGNPQRHFHAGGTVVREKYACQSVIGKKSDNGARQLNCRRIREPQERSVCNMPELPSNPFVDVRVIVPMDVRPDR